MSCVLLDRSTRRYKSRTQEVDNAALQIRSVCECSRFCRGGAGTGCWVSSGFGSSKMREKEECDEGGEEERRDYFYWLVWPALWLDSRLIYFRLIRNWQQGSPAQPGLAQEVLGFIERSPCQFCFLSNRNLLLELTRYIPGSPTLTLYEKSPKIVRFVSHALGVQRNRVCIWQNKDVKMYCSLNNFHLLLSRLHTANIKRTSQLKLQI